MMADDPGRVTDLRRAAVIVLLLALAAAPAAAAAAPWRPDIRDAAAYANGRHGVIAFAVRTKTRLLGRGLDQQYASASVVKAMLMLAYLREPDVRGRDLTAAEQQLLRPMIRRSDNDAATEIRNRVGNDGLVRVARAAGMGSFATAPSWGSSRITARDQTKLFLRIDALIPERHRAYGMELLRTIVPSQRWGMGHAIPGGWTLYFKGGWGDGDGEVDHQVGLLVRGPHRVSIAVLTATNPDKEYGDATLEGVTRRLVDGLGPQTHGPAVQVAAGLGTTEGAP